MGAESKIEWTHATFNPWWGCVKVSPACKHCYAEGFAKRTGHAVWGGSSRRFFGDKHWAEPLKWNAEAAAAGERRRVFCASMADVFEHIEPGHKIEAERERLWKLIERTPQLDWLLLTKRPQNIMGMIPERWRADLPVNVWVGTTVENQEMAEERISELLRVPASVLFLSCEPLLGPVDLDLPRCETHAREFVHKLDDGTECCSECSADGYSGELSFGHWLDPLNGGISWVICGGESGGGARPMQVEWARALRDQCESEGVAFHFKQWGEHDDGLVRIGKKKAGRLLDGRTWEEFPEVRS
jgi:protein gp37